MPELQEAVLLQHTTESTSAITQYPAKQNKAKYAIRVSTYGPMIGPSGRRKVSDSTYLLAFSSPLTDESKVLEAHIVSAPARVP